MANYRIRARQCAARQREDSEAGYSKVDRLYVSWSKRYTKKSMTPSVYSLTLTFIRCGVSTSSHDCLPPSSRFLSRVWISLGGSNYRGNNRKKLRFSSYLHEGTILTWLLRYIAPFQASRRTSQRSYIHFHTRANYPELNTVFLLVQRFLRLRPSSSANTGFGHLSTRVCSVQQFIETYTWADPRKCYPSTSLLVLLFESSGLLSYMRWTQEPRVINTLFEWFSAGQQ